MNIIRKTLLIAGFSSVLLCSAAFAAEVEIAVNDQNTEETVQTEIQTEAQPQENILAEIIEQTTVKKGIVTVDILNVRSGPTTETEILGKLSLGTTVEILSEGEGWYEINFDSKVAYICGEYVRVVDSTMAESQNSGIGIVEYAKTFLGTPYAYGGNTPRGFDCSGFVQYVMANFGVTMPHSSHDQYSIGVRVEKSQLMPGDLVFFKYSSSYRLNHVGIYVGNGNFIHSPVPGQAVQIDSLTTGYFSYYYYGATRVIK
jgi:uncharacterized protein YgiM (DUF1202 family)